MMMDGIKEAINRVVDSQDLPKEIIAGLLREWVGTYCTRDAGRDSTRGFSAFVTSMHKHGILETDYKIVRYKSHVKKRVLRIPVFGANQQLKSTYLHLDNTNLLCFWCGERYRHSL